MQLLWPIVAHAIQPTYDSSGIHFAPMKNDDNYSAYDSNDEGTFLGMAYWANTGNRVANYRIRYELAGNVQFGDAPAHKFSEQAGCVPYQNRGDSYYCIGDNYPGTNTAIARSVVYVLWNNVDSGESPYAIECTFSQSGVSGADRKCAQAYSDGSAAGVLGVSVVQLNNTDVALYKAVFDSPDDSNSEIVGEVNENDLQDEDQANNCQTSSFGLGWIACSIIEFFDQSLQPLVNENFIEPLLFVELGPDAEEVWDSVRGVANIMFVVVFLLIIFAQALGFSDAYTIKRMLPRLILGVILTQMSFFIMRILVDIFNVLGVGVADLILSSLGGGNYNLDFTVFGGEGASVAQGTITTALFATGGALVAAASLSSIIAFALTIWPTIFIAIMLIIFVLTLRKFALLLMIVFSPIAFIAWILPNTEKFFKEWMDNFMKLLLMFPIIMAFLSVGPILSGALGNAGANQSAVDSIIIVIAYVAPYLAIPFTFRLAGRLFGGLATTLQGVSGRLKGGSVGGARGGGKRQTAGSGGKMEDHKARIEAGGLFKANTGVRGALNRGAAKASATSPLKPSSYRPSKYRAAVAEKMQNYGAQEAESNTTFAANAQDENYLALLAADPSGERDEVKGKMLEEKTRTLREKSNARTAGQITSAEYDQAKLSHDQGVAAINKAANQVAITQNDSAPLRQRALTQLATTGRHFEAGEAGYNEMATMAASIAGGTYDDTTGSFVPSGTRFTTDAAKESASANFGSIMNETQAMAGRAGRWDLAGTNSGAGYNLEQAWTKANTYEIGNGKPQPIIAMHDLALEKLQKGDEAGAARIWHDFDAIHSNAKGEVANTIYDKIGPRGARTATIGGQTVDVEAILDRNPADKVGARKYERPNPNTTAGAGGGQAGGGPAGGGPAGGGGSGGGPGSP